MCHSKDLMWPIDLLYYYTHVSVDPLGDTGYTRSWFDTWHGKPDHSKAKEERHKVYELLLDEPKPSYWGDSDVLWNQANVKFLKHMKSRFPKMNLFCGPAVNIFFSKYMRSASYPPKRRWPRKKAEAELACMAIIMTLVSYTAMVVGLGHKNSNRVSHYIGIVGHRKVAKGTKSVDRFLFLEPYGETRWGSISYGHTKSGGRGSTSFLRELEYDDTRNELVYANGMDYRLLTY